MAVSYGIKNSSHERSTVYESCKKIVEARNQFQELQSQIKPSDFELKKHMQESANSNVCQIFKQFVENQQEEMDDNKVEVLSDLEKMSNKPELCTENINSFPEKLSVMNQVLLEKKIDSENNKDSMEMSFCLKSEKLKRKLIACLKCDVQFEKRTELALHFKQNHVKKRGRPAVPMECNMCQKKFTCKKDYDIHLQIHSEKMYTCLSCKKMCFLNVPHSCKNVKYEKTKCSVWDACKKVLTEKSFQQVPSENSKFFVPKLPIGKKVVFMNIIPNKITLKNLNIPSDKMKITSLKEKKIINKSNINGFSCGQDSVEQLVSKCRKDRVESDNRMDLQTEIINVAEIGNTKFLCNMCNISFKEIEKYEAHYSIHLLDEFCQIRESDGELHVCNICGRCFTELTTFQTHKCIHVN